MGSNKYKALLT